MCPPRKDITERAGNYTNDDDPEQDQAADENEDDQTLPEPEINFPPAVDKRLRQFIAKLRKPLLKVHQTKYRTGQKTPHKRQSSRKPVILSSSHTERKTHSIPRQRITIDLDLQKFRKQLIKALNERSNRKK